MFAAVVFLAEFMFFKIHAAAIGGDHLLILCIDLYRGAVLVEQILGYDVSVNANETIAVGYAEIGNQVAVHHDTSLGLVAAARIFIKHLQ